MTPTTKTTPEVRPADPGTAPEAPGPARVAPGEPVPSGPDERRDPFVRRGSHEDPLDYDARWRDEIYQGPVPQLTLRAVATGTVLGSILAVSNLYVGLKAGWSLSVTITALVLSTALWRVLTASKLARSGMSLLEQNCMQSTAAAAANTSSVVLVTAVPAWMLVTDRYVDPFVLVGWTFLVSVLGLALALPFKRQLLHYERLAWPSAVAMAQTLRTLHARGSAAVDQARWLFGSALVAGAVRWSIGNTFGWWKLPAWPETLSLPGRWGALGIGIDASALYYAAGALLGPRVSGWMLVGSASVWLGFVPWLLATGRIDEPGYGAVMFAGALWAGAGIMVASGITSLFLQAGVLLRGLQSLRRPATAGTRRVDPLRGIEVPMSWAAVGVVVAAVGIVWIGERGLGIPWWLSLVGVAVAMVLASVAIRAYGETDITPAGPLGKVMQLGYGVAAPRALSANLFGTTIVVGSAAVAADTSANLRCGHLLGADPRKQFLAQFLGLGTGIVVAVAAFGVLVPDPSAVGTATLPAPAAQAWRAVAQIVSDGLGALDGVARAAVAVGVLIGVGLTLGDRLGSRRPAWWPSPFGLGIGMVIGVAQSTAFFVGAMMAVLLRRKLADRDEANDRIVALSSGGIAGDSLVGVLLALLVALGWMST